MAQKLYLFAIYLVRFFMTVAIIYGAFSFILWERNFALWETYQRILYTIVTLGMVLSLDTPAEDDLVEETESEEKIN